MFVIYKSALSCPLKLLSKVSIFHFQFPSELKSEQHVMGQRCFEDFQEKNIEQSQ